MTSPERFLAMADDLIRSMSEDGGQRARRSVRRGRRVLVKILKVGALMVLTGFVIPIFMIAAGLLLGPRGIEGLIAAPLAVLTAWGIILWWAFGSRPSRRTLAKTNFAELPVRVEAWLDNQRTKLPVSVQPQLDAISLRLEALVPQVRGLDPQLLEAMELRRLIGEELPDLVLGYQKVPPELQRQPLHGGPSPERRLVEALDTIDEQIGRLHHRLAQGDLHSLATQQRYLEIKYKGDDELK